LANNTYYEAHMSDELTPIQACAQAGDFDGALRLAKEALQNLEEADASVKERCDARGMLAAVHFMRGDLTESISQRRQVIADLEHAYPKGHGDLASAYRFLADDLTDFGKQEEAEEFLRREREMMAALGPLAGVEYAYEQRSQAYNAMAEGDKALAEACYRKALASFAAAGEAHLDDYIDVARDLANLLHMDVGDTKAAEVMIRECIADLDARGCAHTRSKLEALKVLGGLLGNIEDHLELLEQCRSLNAEHRILDPIEGAELSSQQVYACLDCQLFDRALQYAERALQEMQAACGAAHPDTLNAIDLVARVHTANGASDRAVRVLSAAVERFRGAGPDAVAVYRAATLNLIGLLVDVQDIAGAAQHCEAMLDEIRQQTQPDPGGILEFAQPLSQFLLDIERSDEVEATILEALAALDAIQATDPHRYDISSRRECLLADLANCYRSHGRSDEAERIDEQLDHLRSERESGDFGGDPLMAMMANSQAQAWDAELAEIRALIEAGQLDTACGKALLQRRISMGGMGDVAAQQLEINLLLRRIYELKGNAEELAEVDRLIAAAREDGSR
jgi:tetratricopeptide (TPR) repeat protein